MRIAGSAAAVAAATRDDALAEIERLERIAEAERGAIAAAAGPVVDDRERLERIAEATRHARQEEVDQEWCEAQEDLRIRDVWMQSVVDRGRARLASSVDADAIGWLDRLVEEAAHHLPPGPCLVLLAKNARSIVTPERIRRWCERTGRALSTEYADIAGGCLVRTSDGRMAFDNTLEARERRLEPLWRSALARAYAEAISRAAPSAPDVEVP